MRETFRTYALGLLTATLIIGLTYLLINPTNTAAEEPVKPTVEKMKQMLTDEGYRILTNAEYQAMSKEENAQNEESSEEVSASNTEPLYVFSMNIVAGTTTPEISEQLVNAKIIDDAGAFTDLMEDGDYSRYIQQGFVQVDSSMNPQQIAEAITSK